MAWFFYPETIGSSLDHDLMASIWEKAISIMAGNLNSSRSCSCTMFDVFEPITSDFGGILDPPRPQNFEQISQFFDTTVLSRRQKNGRFFSSFMAFWEYLNFIGKTSLNNKISNSVDLSWKETNHSFVWLHWIDFWNSQSKNRTKKL